MKNILYLDTTPDITEPPKVIKEIAEHYGYQVQYHSYFSRDSFESFIDSTSRPYEILYFASHGDPNGVQCGDQCQTGITGYTWPELGALFCRSQGLNENSTIFLASCDGGFKRGAMILMANCTKINAVAGLPCKIEVSNEAIIFHAFLRHLCKNSSSSQIEEAVTLVSGQQFKMFKRYEMDVEIGLFTNIYPDLCFLNYESSGS